MQVSTGCRCEGRTSICALCRRGRVLPRFCSSLFGGRAKDNLFSCQLVSFNPVSRVNAVSARAFFRSSNIKDGAYLGIVSQLSLQVRDNSSAASLCVVVDGLSASRASDAPADSHSHSHSMCANSISYGLRSQGRVRQACESLKAPTKDFGAVANQISSPCGEHGNRLLSASGACWLESACGPPLHGNGPWQHRALC